MEQRPTYIASCSFGKDSIATILLALENNEPLDRIVFVEVMFDNKRGISGEDPDHIKWVKEVAIPKIEALWGGKVDVIRNDGYDYMAEFYKVRGDKTKYKDRVGKLQGFLFAGRCRMNGVGKMKPLRAYRRQFPNARYYVGIALDEPKRLERLTKEDISLLAKYGYTEQDAFRKCAEYGLISPIYASARRNGCWFCPNRRMKDWLIFRDKHPDLWRELAELDKVPNRVSPYFTYGRTFEELNKRLDWMKRQMKLF